MENVIRMVITPGSSRGANRFFLGLGPGIDAKSDELLPRDGWQAASARTRFETLSNATIRSLRGGLSGLARRSLNRQQTRTASELLNEECAQTLWCRCVRRHL